MDISVAAFHDVLHNRAKCVCVEPMAVNAAAQVTEGIQRCWMGDDDTVTIFETEPVPGRFR